MQQIEEKKLSPYAILNRWLRDGSRATQIPVELKEDKAIGTQYLLYYFQASPHIVWLNKHFNKYELFQMNKVDMFYFLKECVLRCRYEPPFIKRKPSDKIKIHSYLKRKYPQLKDFDVAILANKIEDREDRDSIHEMAGLIKDRKKKTTAKEKKELLGITTKKIKEEDLLKDF